MISRDDLVREARLLWDADREHLKVESPKWDMPAWSKAAAWRRKPYLHEARERLCASSPQPPEPDLCPVCSEPLRRGDVCATDIEMGTCHAECLRGSPAVDLETGEPSDGPISTYPYEPDPRQERDDAAT